MSKDTVFSSLDCTFKKDSSDSIFGFYFDAERTIGEVHDYYSYDTGCFISASKESAELFQSTENLGELISLQHNYDFFNPLNNFSNSEMSDLEIDLVRFINKEKIGNSTVFHYRYIPLKDPDDEVQILKSALDFWINTKDAVPVRYSVYYQVDFSGDTLEQYDEYNLVSYSLDNQAAHKFRTPDFFVKKGMAIKEHRLEGPKPVQKLVIGSKVPSWSFETNLKTRLSSENLSYELVLFDFYFQGCYPCLKAIPYLNELNRKYHLKERGLLVVGINNVDQVDDRFDEFVKRKRISYPLAITPNNLDKEFVVTGYPTLFLVNKKGELIYTLEGYSEESETALEQIIIEELRKTGLLK